MFSNHTLNVNEAGFLVTTNCTGVTLYAQAVDCYECDLVKWIYLNVSSIFLTINTISNWNFQLRDENYTLYCSENNVNFGENGVYQWNYPCTCEPIINVSPPADPYQPVYYFETFLLSFVCLKLLFKYVFHRLQRRNRLRSVSTSGEIDGSLGPPSDARELIQSSPEPSVDSASARIKSLDVFRGFTICLMIFVNYGGGQYWFFQHSPWNGITIADFVFPCFAWIMGVGIAIKIKFDKRNSISTRNLIFHCVRRSLILIILGLIVSNLGNNDLASLRYFGVLQRLGIAYFFVTLLEITFMEPQTPRANGVYSQYFPDLLESWKQWCFVIACVILHTCLTFFLQIPGCPQGYLGPGGLADHAQYVNCTGGAAGYIDRWFGEKHLFSKPTCQTLYKCEIPFDPEGALGTLTAILCVYFGVYAGRIILVYKTSSKRIPRWLFTSLLCIIIALLLSGGRINGGLIPMNKNLWSLSYVLMCSGIAFLLFIVIYILVDHKNWHSGSPWYQVGRHSLTIYVGHSLTENVFPWDWKPLNKSYHTEYFIMNTWATLLWILIARYIFSDRKLI